MVVWNNYNLHVVTHKNNGTVLQCVCACAVVLLRTSAVVCLLPACMLVDKTHKGLSSLRLIDSFTFGYSSESQRNWLFWQQHGPHPLAHTRPKKQPTTYRDEGEPAWKTFCFLLHLFWFISISRFNHHWHDDYEESLGPSVQITHLFRTFQKNPTF